MAKKGKKLVCEEMAPWLITFTDVMTLMLTFFVLLVSMSTVDERRKLVVLGSIIGTFGFNTDSYRVYTRKDTRRTVEPGPVDSGDLMPLKPLMWDYAEQDFDFRSSHFVQVLSVNADILFAPGSPTITPAGEQFLKTVLPTLKGLQFPLLIAGHTAEMRDELGLDYNPGDDHRRPDLSWKISLNRTLAVYQWLIANGMNPELIKMEGYGKFKAHWPQNSPADRAKNRRVDFVLDKRSSIERDRITEPTKAQQKAPDAIDVNGFFFDLRDTTPEQ